MQHRAESRQWCVVYSKSHKEESARFHLELKGIEVFLPRLWFPRSVKRRERVVPLFPNYLFVHLSIPEEYYYVLWCPGIKRFVSFNGVPAKVDEDIVVFLKQRGTAEGIITARSNLRAGQQVHVTGGPFDGLIGIIQKPPDSKGRVKVLLNLLSRQVKADIPVDFIKSDWLV